MPERIFLIVLDSFGAGALPDADAYGDEGSNTILSVSGSGQFKCPNLTKLGLFNIDTLKMGVADPCGAYGAAAEKSAGKDTTTGHWEIAGIITEKPFPTFPEGFPDEVIDLFIKATGRQILCNRPFSGTEVIKAYGDEHIATGSLIVYTSADSVFQIAAHEDIIPLEELYRCCEKARTLLTGDYGVGRVIARPFKGKSGEYYRTGGRKDYSLPPMDGTVLDNIKNAGLDVISVGKIDSIFCGKGITRAYHTENNTEGMEHTEKIFKEDFKGLCFVNLVDFDMLYGHRNDIDGYAAALSEFDRFLGSFMKKLKKEDLLIITADHGCDPGTPSTNHSREYVPVLCYSQNINPVNLGIRNSFSDIGATVCDILGAKPSFNGISFKNKLF